MSRRERPSGPAIGIDVGGTFIKVGVVDAGGTIIRQHQVETAAERGPDAILERIAEQANILLAERDDIVALGLGVPGVINDRGEIAYPPNLPGWEIVPVANRLRPLLQRKLAIAVENDANVAGFAESRVGSARSDPSFLFITLGTGIGGCIIVDRAIWRGGGGGAGEVGHITIDSNGPLCACGARGCIEAYLGQRYMTALARERIERAPDSSLHALVARGEDPTPRHLAEAADAGDTMAIDLFAELGTLLGAALASVLNLCDLSLVIVGGGVSRAGRHILEPTSRALQARALKSIASRIEVRQAVLGNDAGIVGAALLGIERGR
jgi:glucokinase